MEILIYVKSLLAISMAKCQDCLKIADIRAANAYFSKTH